MDTHAFSDALLSCDREESHPPDRSVVLICHNVCYTMYIDGLCWLGRELKLYIQFLPVSRTKICPLTL